MLNRNFSRLTCIGTLRKQMIDTESALPWNIHKTHLLINQATATNWSERFSTVFLLVHFTLSLGSLSWILLVCNCFITTAVLVCFLLVIWISCCEKWYHRHRFFVWRSKMSLFNKLKDYSFNPCSLCGYCLTRRDKVIKCAIFHWLSHYITTIIFWWCHLVRNLVVEIHFIEASADIID